MQCREVRQLAEAFVGEQLPAETTHAVVAHLQECPTCGAALDQLRRLRNTTRAAFERAPELSVRPAFAAELAARLQPEAGRHRGTRMSRRRWLALAAGTVAGVGWGWREWAHSPDRSMARVAVGDHRFCALTFKLAEPPIPLEEAARRYGPLYERFKTVEPSTTALSGGPLRILARHSCVFENRRFIHVVLDYKDEKVSLLVPTAQPGVDGTGRGATVEGLRATDGFHVASFSRERHAVFVVSSLDDHDVQEVARALIAPVSRALSAVSSVA